MGDSILCSLHRCLRVEGMHQAHFQIALVRRIDAYQVLSAGAYLIKLPLRQLAVEPSHACAGGAAASRWQKNLEPAANPLACVMLAAIGEPENAESKHAIDDGLALPGIDADDSPALLAAHQQASPMAIGNYTAMPLMAIAATSRILATLKMTPAAFHGEWN